MSKKHIIILFLILSLAIILRSIPVWTNYTWGADFGIYYGITSRLITNQQIYVPYDGWGGTYNYFPILYIVSAFSHWLTGMKLIWVMPRVAPIFGGFTVLIFYFIVYNLTKKRNLALLSSAFLAVAPFHVYQTSHAAPLTMGHFFMMLSLYLFIKYTMENKYPVLLMFSSTLLIMSHHLTTYFYAISLFSIIIFKSMQKNIKQLNRDITYFVTFSTMMFLYWALIATPVFRNIFKRGLPFHPVVTVMLFYALFFSALLLVYLIKKYRQNWVETLQKIIGYKRPFNHKIALTYFLVSIFTVFSLEIFFMTTPFPVSGIRMTTLGFFFSIPFVLFIGLGFMGLEYLRKTENNWFFQGYSIALTLSLCYALLTESHVFYPDRHIEYLVIPVSFFASLAVLTFYEKDVKIDFKFRKKIVSPLRNAFVIIIIGIIFTNAVAVYPSYSSLNWMDEGIPTATVNAIEWATEHLDVNTTVFASDLRLCKLLWAKGYNVTYGYTNETWWCWNWSECEKDLDANENHSRVTHVLIDNVMREVSVNLALTVTYYMTNESYEKFKKEPFTLIYRNATQDDWAEIYAIKWNDV